MNEKERDELMAFLREAMAVRDPCDRAAQRLIDQTVAQNPLIVYWLVQQVMGLRLALQSRTEATPPGDGAAPARSWGSGVLKTALAAGLGAAAGTVLAHEAADWLDQASSDLDLG
ncbi:MAG: hypothetical protein ACKOCZ_09825 [Betaproteobacteria bacterium]